MKTTTILITAIAASLLISAGANGMQTGAATPAKTGSADKATRSKKADAAPPPSTQEIADARAKGLVWTNSGTRVYHKEGEFYGKTKRGKFMTEDEAKAAGFHAAQEPATSKNSKNAKGKAASVNTSGTDATLATHTGNTPKP